MFVTRLPYLLSFLFAVFLCSQPGSAIPQDEPQVLCGDLEIYPDYLVVCDDRDNELQLSKSCYQALFWSTGEQSSSITVNSSGTFWVYARSRDTGEEGYDTIVVRQGNPPKPVIGNPVEYLCAGEVAKLQAPNTMKSYLWSTGETGNEITVSKAGIYWLEVVDSNDCVGRSDEIEIIIVEPPTPAIAGPNSVCRNSAGTYAIEATPNSAYIWFADGGTILSGQGTQSVVVEWARNGRLEVEVIQDRPDGGTCSGKAGMFITVGDKLNPEILYTRSSLCVGDTIELEAPLGYDEYLWSTGATSRTITVTTGGPYWVSVKDASGCDGISDTLKVREYEVPSASIIGPRAICGVGQVVTLQGVDALGDIVLWDWSTGDRTSTIEVSQPGTYTLVAWNLNGCTDTARFTVAQATPLVVTAPTVDFGINEIGSQPTQTLEVTNTSGIDVSVMEILGLPNDISITPLPPRLVADGAAESFTLQWTTQQVETINHTITFVLASADCADTIQTTIIGQVVNTDTVGVVQVLSIDTTLKVGSYLSIPINLDINLPVGENVEVRFDATFNNDVFHVDDIQGAQVLLDVTAGVQRTLTLSYGADADTTDAVLLSGYTLLGAPFQTSVDITNTAAISNAPFIIDEQGGSITLTGCWLPGRMVQLGALQLVRRVFTIDGREVTNGDFCRPCLEVFFDSNGRPVGSYLTNNISR